MSRGEDNVFFCVITMEENTHGDLSNIFYFHKASNRLVLKMQARFSNLK